MKTTKYDQSTTPWTHICHELPVRYAVRLPKQRSEHFLFAVHHDALENQCGPRSLTFSHGNTNLSQPRAWLWSRTTTVLIGAHDKASTKAHSEVLIVPYSSSEKLLTQIRGYLPSGQAWTLYLSHRRKLCCKTIWHIVHTCRADINIETRMGRRHRTILD